VFAVRDATGPQTQAAVAATGGRARAAAVNAAVRDAEVVVLAVPFAAVANVLDSAGAMTGEDLDRLHEPRRHRDASRCLI
jgi:predicted dinucleotide-binding enzyme